MAFRLPCSQAVAAVLRATPAKSSNPWHSSICSRSKRLLDDLAHAVQLQEEVCSGWAKAPRKLLSFGCSVGIELEEALARFPKALAVGYDLDPEVLALARSRLGPLQLVSDYDRLPADFDLILAPLASKG